MGRSALGWLVAVVALSCGCAAPPSPVRAALEAPPRLEVGLRFSPTAPTPPPVRGADLVAGPAVAAEVAVADPPQEPIGPRSAALPSGFHNPMPGGVMAGYQA